MTGTIHFDLVSPERLLLSDDVDMVTVPGADGYFGVLAGHAPVMAGLKPGIIEVKGGVQDGLRLFVRGGFAEVNPTHITVLAEEAMPLSEFDVAALEQCIKDTEEDLIAAKTDVERARITETLDHLRLVRAVL